MSIMEQVQQAFYEQITIEPASIPIVILAALAIYLFFLILVRLFGVRIMTKMNAFDAVVLVMFGAVSGRVVIGHPPTLAAGAIGLFTLMLLEAIFGAARKSTAVSRIFDEDPQAVFAHGQYLDRQLRRTHVARDDLRMVMRRAGVASPADVQLIILEPTGEMSVYKAGIEIDPEMLRGVVGLPSGFTQHDRENH